MPRAARCIYLLLAGVGGGGRIAMLSMAKNAVKARIHDFIDAQITAQLKPYLETGKGPNGDECSDIVVNEDSDISIENMIVKTSVVNDTLMKSGTPFRVSMVCAKRIFFDIPWDNITSREACWKLEVDGLMVVVQPLEREGWNVDNLRAARGNRGLDARLLVHRLDVEDDVPRRSARHAQGRRERGAQQRDQNFHARSQSQFAV